MNFKFPTILIVFSCCLLVQSCNLHNFETSSNEKSETLADIKKRIWLQVPRDEARALKTVIEFDIKTKIPIGYPAALLLSNDNTLLIDDNTNGKMYRISSDFQSITDLGIATLSRPTIIKEHNNNLIVHDNTGINIFNKNGQFIKTIKSYFKIEDFDLLNEETYIVSLAELKLDIDSNHVAVLDSNGKRVDSFSKTHESDYSADIENRAFISIQDGRIYVCYKFNPLVEIYDVQTKNLIQSFEIRDSSFSSLLGLKKDKKFINPEAGKFNLPKFIAGLKLTEDKIYVLLHTPNPVIVEFTLDGEEVQRYISTETDVLNYFGFDIRLDKNTKQFFVGTIDYSSKPSIMVYEVN